MNDFPKHFDHATREREIYEAWESAGVFRADRDSKKPPFVISMPPPNATGPLHIGHAMTLTIEDIMIRWRRMAGDEVLWLPGTDHASLATEGAVIRRLQGEGIDDPRRTLGHDRLLQEISASVEKSREQIREQIRGLGCSCDWSRERYTLEPELNRLVNEVFGRMFRDGLIYRGNRIVSWDVDLGTTLSDEEIHVAECAAPLYFIRYGSRLSVATYRPEMMLGDTALAVHPEDENYRELIGQEVEVSWPRGPKVCVKVIPDNMVDRYFGLGVFGVTPAHDPEDFERAKRHGLPLVTIVGEDGRMTAAAGPYAGLTTKECREAFLKDLRDADLFIMEKTGPPRKMRFSYRGGKPVEYLPKGQWFVDVNLPVIPWAGKTMSFRQVMEDVVRSEQIRFLPESQKKRYLDWIGKLRDWCISRQIWWGHRVPVWYRGRSETHVGVRPPEGEGWIQDPDTLDTWFSSALWTWSTLTDSTAARDLTLTLEQILERSPDYQHFHPTSVLDTGHDILLFWVARMILMTTYATGRIPFHNVYLHGLVRDKSGRRMSTARPELCINPNDTIKERGADTLRLALIGRASTSANITFTNERVAAARHFIDKLWNAAHYVADNGRFDGPPPGPLAHPVNRWMRRKVDDAVGGVTKAFGEFEFGEAAKLLCDAFRDDFCNRYIEATKTKDLRELAETQRLLGHSFEIYLHLLHPFIPFVTEELWKTTGHDGFLMQHEWPAAGVQDENSGGVQGVETLFRLVTASHAWRSNYHLKRSVAVDLQVWAKSDLELLEACAPLLRELIPAQSVHFVASKFEGNLIKSDELAATIAQSSGTR